MGRREHLLGIGVALVLFGVLAIAGRPDLETGRAQRPIAETPSYPPIDDINTCRRLLVSRSRSPPRSGSSRPSRRRRSPPSSAAGTPRRSGGLMVVGASSGFASPPRAGPIRQVQGIGEQALFTPQANRDFPWVSGPAGAASMLQVRVGDLVLRFAGGRFDASTRTFRSYRLSALRRLAADALATSRAWS